MIFNFSNNTRFYIFGDSVDMRKGIHSLYHLVQGVKEMNALSGNSFVFIGKNRKSIKILRWQKEGFVLYYKKLELGRYTLPHTVEDGVFFEADSDIVDTLVNVVKHKSTSNELRTEVLLTL